MADHRSMTSVHRVEDEPGSHIEPPLDDDWDDLTKLSWHLAATLLDAGLPQTGMVVRLMTGGTGPLDDFPMYELGVPGYSVGPLSYTAMWDVINGVEFGAQAARASILGALRELDAVGCENEKDYPAYANATWDAIERIQRAAGIEELWPE